MQIRKWLALLVSAALALSLLAGCGGGKALSQVVVDLLDGLYSNISVEADSELTAALKKAAAEGGTEEEILSRMIEILNHKGGSITFTRLGSGQQGDHAVTLYFQTGTDPDAAARNALAQWASTLGTLPDDGSFQGDVAMIEAENGYYIALNVEVLKAGTPDKSDQSDADDDNHLGYTENSANSYTVSTAQGFDDLVTLKKEDIASTSITLDCDVTLPENWPDGLVYTASFDGGNHTVGGVSGNGMFDEVAFGASVKNVKFADVKVSGDGGCGTVAATNNGTITNCDVTINAGSSITAANGDTATYAGGIAGENGGTITNCDVTINTGGSITATNNMNVNVYAGGIAGTNESGCEISGCKVTINGGSITATNESNYVCAGGIAGENQGTISKCHVNGGNTASADISAANGGTVTCAGGIAGYNQGTVDGCFVSYCKIEADNYNIIAAGGIVGWSSKQENVACESATGCYITARAGENTATATGETKTDSTNEGRAYAGAKIGYDDGSDKPGPVG